MSITKILVTLKGKHMHKNRNKNNKIHIAYEKRTCNRLYRTDWF